MPDITDASFRSMSLGGGLPAVLSPTNVTVLGLASVTPQGSTGVIGAILTPAVSGSSGFFGSGGGGGPNTPPTVTNVTPAVGTTIGITQPLDFDVLDAEGLTRVVVLVTYPNGSYEVVHDGDFFAAQYSSSSRSPITNGYHFSVLRNAGWSANPTIRVIASDTCGAEWA